MKFDDLKVWILDTLSEGGYSIKELYEYISKSAIDESAFLSAIQSLLDENLIVLDVDPTLDQDSSKSMNPHGKMELEKLAHILRQDLSGASRNAIDLSQDGRSLLKGMGIGYPENNP